MFTYSDNTALNDKYWDACYKGDVKVVRELVTKEKKSLKTDDFLLRCTKMACKGGHLEIFNILNTYKNIVTLCENDDYDDDDPLDIAFYNACKGGNLDIIKQLVEIMEREYTDQDQRDKEQNVHFFFKNGLHGACKGGHLVVCTLCMSFLWEPETSDDINILLYYACASDNIDVVKLIIEYGNKFHADWDWNEALETACMKGCIKVAKLLVEYGADDFDTGLENACLFEQPKTIKFMIECGGAPMADSYLEDVCRTGDMDLTIYYLNKFPVELSDLSDGVCGACLGGNLKIVKLLLKKGKQMARKEKRLHGEDAKIFVVNWDKCMVEACRRNHMIIVNFLVDKPIFNFCTSVVEAKKCWNIDIVNFLLSRCPVDLYVACMCGNLPLVEMHLKDCSDSGSGSGSDDEEDDDDNGEGNELEESLKVSCEHNHYDVAKLLLAHGAGSRLTVINECMNIACYAGNCDIVKLMLSYGATNIDECFETNYDHDNNIDIYNVLIAAGATELYMLKDVDDLKLYCLYCEYKGIKLDRERYNKLLHNEPACVLFSGCKLTRRDNGGNDNNDKRKCSIIRLPHDLFNMMILY